MTAASSSLDRSASKVMPGAFDPKDYADIEENPFDVLAQVQEAWRRRDPPVLWSTNNLPELNISSIDWYLHDPPAALQHTTGVTSDVLLDIVTSSTETIKTRATEENRLKNQEEEEKNQRILAENEAAKTQKPRDEAYFPIIIVEPPKPEQPNDTATGTTTASRPELRLQSEKTEDIVASHKSHDDSTEATGVNSSALRAEAVRAVRQNIEKARALGFRKRLFHRGSDKTDGKTEGSGFDIWRRRHAGSHDIARQSAPSPSQGSVKTSSSDDDQELVECVSCLDDFPTGQLIKVPCHSYCFDCFPSLVSTAVQNEQQWPPKCCLNEIPFRTILKYTTGELQQRFRDRSSELSVPVNERVYCSRAECSLWIRPDHINPALRQGRCAEGHWTCTLCHGPDHEELDCPQDRDMDLTYQLAEEEGWKRCYNCNALVEHKDACQHMTCRCGAQFCYVCNERWRTCSCTMDQLSTLKSEATTRREQREAKEQVMAEELRQMLAEIEEFEREETLKAELLRQEQLRLEEERQQRELEEKVRQESHRRKKVDVKFTELRSALGQLHELQQATIVADQEMEVESTKHELSVENEELEKKQVEEEQELATSMQTRLQHKDASFNEDFASRAISEKKIMDDYHAKLAAYYRNRPHGDQEIEKAMLPLQRRMEQGYRAWQQWKRQEMESYREVLEENNAIKQELMYSMRQRLAEKAEEVERSLAQKATAERLWFNLVVLERERLLGEQEMQEMEGDADSIFAMDGAISEVAVHDDLGSSSRASSSQSTHNTERTLEDRKESTSSAGPSVRYEEISLLKDPWDGPVLTTDNLKVLGIISQKRPVVNEVIMHLDQATTGTKNIGMAL